MSRRFDLYPTALLRFLPPCRELAGVRASLADEQAARQRVESQLAEAQHALGASASKGEGSCLLCSAAAQLDLLPVRRCTSGSCPAGLLQACLFQHTPPALLASCSG